MDKSERRRLHRKVGHLLKKTGKGGDEEVAHHLTKDLIPEEETEELCRYLLNTAVAILYRYNERLGWKYLKLAKGITERFPHQLKKEDLMIEAELSRLCWILGRDVPSIEDMERLIKRLEVSGLRREAVMLYRILFYRALAALNLEIAEKYLKQGLSLSEESEENFWILRVERCLLKRRKKRQKDLLKRLTLKLHLVPSGKFFTISVQSLWQGETQRLHRGLCLKL